VADDKKLVQDARDKLDDLRVHGRRGYHEYLSEPDDWD